MCFFKLQCLWRMLTWTFISRPEPPILGRTRSHTHLFLLQGTSLQFSKRTVLWEENQNPPLNLLWCTSVSCSLHVSLLPLNFLLCTEAKQGSPWARSLPRFWLKTHSLHLPIYFTTLHLQTGFKSLIIAHLSLASFWQTSWMKCHISLLMTITTAPALSSL